MHVVVSLGNALHVGNKSCLYEFTELNFLSVGSQLPPRTLIKYIQKIHQLQGGSERPHVVKLIMKAVGRQFVVTSGCARFISSNSLTATSKLMHDVLERSSELAYTELDFPESFVDMAHPEDYKEAPEPVQPEVFYHRTRDPHHRLLLRASFRLSSKVYSPMTFICDTGLSAGFYFSPHAMSILTKARRILQNDIQCPFIETGAGKIPVSEAQQLHQPANLLGLHALQKYGLTLADKPSFATPFKYF